MSAIGFHSRLIRQAARSVSDDRGYNILLDAAKEFEATEIRLAQMRQNLANLQKHFLVISAAAANPDKISQPKIKHAISESKTILEIMNGKNPSRS